MFFSIPVTITHKLGLDGAANDDATGTVRAHSTNFKMYNINMINTRGEGSQAMAISAYAGVSLPPSFLHSPAQTSQTTASYKPHHAPSTQTRLT